ncbi:hypothetical protein [Streptomyces griseosporeus]|uniref:hypothetical protein n=1 Tax=Streptomyces griseosporeus TaxID=1910 RepID=UPI00370319F3
MGDEDYWLALSRGGALSGGGFFVTRSYALTSEVCVRGLRRGDPVDVHTAGGLRLEGVLFEVAEDLGLALIGVRPDPLADYATPPADHAVKGDAWRAPYRPSPVAALLRGAVDAVTHDVRDRGGPPLCVLELTSEPALPAYDDYAGGPVERRTEGRAPAVIGVLLWPGTAGRPRAGTDGSLTASALGSAFESFDALSAEKLMGLLCEGFAGPARPADLADLADPARPADPADPVDPAGPLGPRTPVPVGPPAPAGAAGAAALAGNDGAPRPADRARGAFDTAWAVLRAFKQMADEGLIDQRTVSPFHIRVLDEVVREVWRGDEP